MALALLLVAYNNTANLLPGFQRRYVPASVGLCVLLLAAGRLAGGSWATLGVGGSAGRGATLGGAVAIVVCALLAAGLAVPRLRRLLADRRLVGVSPARLAFLALVRIPLGTALLEEVAFRGVLFGICAQQQSVAAAVAGSSVAFGLWHVTPTLALIDANRPAAAARARWSAVAAAVVFTAAAGAGLCALRVAGGGLLAPFLAHAGTNALAAVAAFVALRWQ